MKEEGTITGGPYQGQRYVLPKRGWFRNLPGWRTVWLRIYEENGQWRGFIDRDIPEKYLESEPQ